MISIREPLVNTMNDYGGLGIVLEEAENENNLSNLSQQQTTDPTKAYQYIITTIKYR